MFVAGPVVKMEPATLGNFRFLFDPTKIYKNYLSALNAPTEEEVMPELALRVMESVAHVSQS